MRRIRLFCSDLNDGSVLLSPEESRHAAVSLRLRPGDKVIVFDGAGREALGVVSDARAEDAEPVRRRRVRIDVGKITLRPFELAYRVTLAVAVAKPHRQGYLIEKCTELGVSAIWPIVADRSVGRASPGAIEKWFRRAIEAAKQSGRTWVPTIAQSQTYVESLSRGGEFDAVCMADVGAAAPLGSHLSSQPAPAGVLVFVGPEGGWSDAERSQALEAGVTFVGLGPTVLRTETAAVAVCAAAGMCGNTSVSHDPA